MTRGCNEPEARPGSGLTAVCFPDRGSNPGSSIARLRCFPELRAGVGEGISGFSESLNINYFLENSTYSLEFHRARTEGVGTREERVFDLESGEVKAH